MTKQTCIVALVLFAWPLSAKSDDDRCDHCGCSACCRSVCRCVPSTKKVTKTTYDCECEDFCVPGPSDHCVTYDECGKKKHVYTPTCAEVRTRKKLVKHETTTEVPTTKWVVEKLCDACACKCCDQSGNGTSEPAQARTTSDVIKTSFRSLLAIPEKR